MAAGRRDVPGDFLAVSQDRQAVLGLTVPLLLQRRGMADLRPLGDLCVTNVQQFSS